ncbi:MAG: ABC transporter permease [Jatrophihabitans sp.]
MTHQRFRGGAFSTLPWLRAPILLLRRPVVFVAIVGASAILAMASASGPLFLSSIGSASLRAQARQTCPENSQPGLEVGATGAQAGATAASAAAALRGQGLPAPNVTAVGETQVQDSLVHLFSGPGALDHVHKLTTSAGPGVWLPDNFARAIGGARPGATITTTDGKPLRVAGIYRALAPDPYSLSNLPRYWCSWTNIIVATVAKDSDIASTRPDLRQGDLLITDQTTVARTVSGTVRLGVHSPLSTSTHPLAEFDAAAKRLATAATIAHTRVDDHLSQLTHRAHVSRSGLTGSIVPIEAAGIVIAGLLVGGAGAFWANARRREIRMLVARGVGPSALAVKAVLETLVPAAIGAAVGFAGTLWLVRAVGPSRVLESDAPWRAAAVVTGSLALGLVLIAAIGGLAARDRTTGRTVSWAARVPWELALITAAVIIATAGLNDSAVSVRLNIVSISALVILYPLLGATGALLLLGRFAGAFLPALGRGARRSPDAVFLALRRMSRSRLIAVGLVVGTALPCCLLMYGSTVRDTVSREVTQKYETNLGAPHVLQVYGVHNSAVALGPHGTQIAAYEDATAGNDQVHVLGVDTLTFADFAYVSDDQRAEVHRLTPGSSEVPAIVVNQQGRSATDLRISRSALTIRPIAHDAVFPGLRDGTKTLIVVDIRALAHVDEGVERTNQIWTSEAQYGAARRIVAAQRYSVLFELTSKVVIDTTGLLPVTWVFGYLRALAILIGIVAVAGLVFGLAARTRSRRVSYVLSRRMGMSKLTHVNSLLLELTTVLGLGWVAGSGLGLGSFGLVFRRLDVFPSLLPPASFSVPTGPLVVAAIIVAVVIVLASLATQALAERTRPAEILRLE